MDDKILNAALAGLLHDIGKVVQRGMIDPWRLPEDARESGQPVHAAWSLRCIESNVPDRYRAAARFGAYHHHPERCEAQDRSLAELVALADKLSAGERADPDEDRKAKDPPCQLVSIFDRVYLSQAEPKITHYLPLQPLSLKRDAIFSNKALSPIQAREAYETLKEGLEKAIRQDTPDAETYLDNALFALQRFTWSVPSAFYYTIPDVSLYDHSRMTAALAVCFAGWEAGRVRSLLEGVTRNFQKKPAPGDDVLLAQPAALLVGGDISGIQNFIYTLSSKQAAKTLRGRSFYLQLLTEAVLRFVLHELGIPYTNVIYSGGGHFYLLAPISARGQLDELRRGITSKLLKHHGSDLYLALGAAEVPASGFSKGAFPEYWGRMHAALGNAKQRRYTELEGDLITKVFQPQEHGGNQEDTCSVCGEERLGARKLEGTEENDRICKLCASFAGEIGTELPQAHRVTLFLGEALERPMGTAFDALAEFGMEVSFNSNQNTPRLLPSANRLVYWQLDDEITPPGKALTGAAMLRYAVNQVPALTFDELQKKAEGIPRLGVLRMDADNVGDVFKRGFGAPGKSIATLARLSSLSFQMSLYFDGWVKKICSEQPEMIYAVYAGGDDLFLIAPWNIVPELATRIAKDFTSYTGENPDLHISGGMTFIHGKYPVYQAAEDAQKALQSAKDLDGKNAFSLLDQPRHWQEFAKVVDKYQKLVKACSAKKEEGSEAPQALLQILRKLAEMQAEKAKRIGKRPEWGPWMWKGNYQLTRMVEQAEKQDKALAEEIRTILKDLQDTVYINIDQWGQAARWAQLFLRKKDKHAKG